MVNKAFPYSFLLFFRRVGHHCWTWLCLDCRGAIATTTAIKQSSSIMVATIDVAGARYFLFPYFFLFFLFLPHHVPPTMTRIIEGCFHHHGSLSDVTAMGGWEVAGPRPPPFSCFAWRGQKMREGEEEKENGRGRKKTKKKISLSFSLSSLFILSLLFWYPIDQ